MRAPGAPPAIMVPSHYIFNHIPKTGGNTLLAICRSNLPAVEISPHLTEHEIRLIPPARFEHFTLIAGHFSILTQASFCRSRYSMTLLRDPILRIVSAYTYWRTAREYNPVTLKAKQLSFAEFVRYFIDSPTIVQNPYAHHFAGIGRDFPGYPADKFSFLAAAKNNLAAFNFIGICEEFEQSARLLCRELGWRLPMPIPHENRSASEETLSGIDPGTMELLREYNRLDYELYAYGRSLFHARGAMQLTHEDWQSVARRTSREAAVQSNGWRVRPVETNYLVSFPAPYAPPRRAVIHAVSTKWPVDEDSRVVQISVTFQTYVEVASLDLGVQVNDTSGKVVWGTSTLQENLKLDYQTGSVCEAVFFVQCELRCGLYFVTAALSEPRRLGFHEHWIDCATTFEVMPRRAGVWPYVRGMMRQDFRSTIDRGGTPAGGPDEQVDGTEQSTAVSA